ncbi:hypothetical protein NECAME_12698 [Necator americanus]|uniref:PXA domain-containing protein n=1 Tax=Necator americanus TaxID=51031 RepID=W2SZ45_NECAM|nr:hypothetical protein NECAME_12698 [Necator americanus]ETN74858.1 hypothetical protein NECAME_12698 [Necator americanus]
MNFHNQTKELLERHPWLCPAVYVFTFVIFLIICLGFGGIGVVLVAEAKVPASVNDAIETLLDQLIDTHQARFACSQLLCKLATLDLPTILAEDVLPTAALHMHRIIDLEDDLSEKVADFLITKLLDDTHLAGRAHDDDGPSRLGENTNMSTWPSQSVRHFTRELIVNTLLLPCLDLIADPDTINHLLIIAFDAQKGDISGATPSHDSDAATVPFLTNFAEHTAQIVPDSLLQLKLSEQKLLVFTLACKGRYLCGSPPVCVNELIDQQSMPRKASVSGGTFSLAQFRSRLRKAIAVVSLDGSLDNEESLNNSLADEDDDISSSCESAPPESCVVIDANEVF